ncbi:LicD family protein [Litoreibacter halocynthiae]|uniref:LicD family protein n=1 Tax=Litoreibacter halocynthiae TaxID=1242689 RepID=UPI0013C336BF|nr:LicD family protein [Litoreibacter halocynthiae]
MDLAKTVFPGYGYFGNKPFSTLKIDVNSLIDTIEMEVRQKSGTYLNLEFIKIIDKNGKSYDLDAVIDECKMSSSFTSSDETDVKDQIIKTGPLHSAKQPAPRLSITLQKPIEVSSLEIGNRGGIYGVRARNLTCTTWLDADQKSNFQNARFDQLEAKLNELCEAIDFDIPKTIRGQNHLQMIANEIRSCARAELLKGDLVLDNNLLYWLLPVFASEPIVTESTLTFIAALWRNLVASYPTFETKHMIDFQRILSTEERVAKVEALTDAMRESASKPSSKIVVGKHNIGTAALFDHKEDYLHSMKAVSDILRENGMEAMICYGTLLGAIRDKGFIPHDDDVDMLYVDTSSNREEMMHNRKAVMQLFKDLDYRIWDSGTNFHVTPPGLRGGVDLFPCYRDGSLLHLMMERYLYRGIPEDIVIPTTEVELYGRTLPAPAKPERLMAERYGETWHTPNPYHEWPWELGTQATPLSDRELAPKPSRTIRIAWGQHLGPGGYSPPKNSAAVIEEALERGFDAVEIDIREAADGKFILAHDDLIINGDDKIVTSEHTAARLKEFKIGEHKGKPQYILELSEALEMLLDTVVMLDPRIPVTSFKKLRAATDAAKISAAKLLFCGYGIEAIREIQTHFPESTVLYKFHACHSDLDDWVLQELQAQRVDGVMLYWPLHYEDVTDFMKMINKRDLSALFYCHGGWPSRGEQDDSEVSLRKMIDAGVHFVTTTACDTESFNFLSDK